MNKRIHIDGLLYVWLGVGPFIVNELNSDTAKEFIKKPHLWAAVVAIGALNIGVAQWKAHRSTAYANELKRISETDKPV